MNIKTIFKVFIFILIPLYIFINPVAEYFSNLNSITYTLDIPNQPNEIKNSDDEPIFSKKDFLKSPKIEKTIIESWVITYPEIDGNKNIKLFIGKLESIGIKSFFYIKKNKKSAKTISIGPYVDRSMALAMQKKVNQLIKYEGKIVRLNN